MYGAANVMMREDGNHIYHCLQMQTDTALNDKL